MSVSIRIMSWVWDNSPYDGTALLLHLRLADHSNDDGYCYPSQKGLSKAARCSVRHIRSLMKQMVDDGYLEVLSVSDGRKNNTYQLRNPSSGGTPLPPVAQIPSRRKPSSSDGGNPLPENHHVTVIEPKSCRKCGTTYKRSHTCFL
jgi:Helix-turn-helix domain